VSRAIVTAVTAPIVTVTVLETVVTCDWLADTPDRE
jgi:hypothetical protein